MAKINVLPKHIADLIAAGEVVERPSSVIKELMENAIDAGATSLTVEIKNGGVTYMRVTDNGSGILRDDIRNAFVSHATSKILNEEDLHGIGTLGFRGEALASICAVSRVDVLTRTADDDVGTVYKIEGSEEILLSDAGCPQGTTIVVKDLFYNTPARMKFLKKDVTEGNSVAGVVDRIALSHPEISIRFIRDDKQILVTPGNGNLKSTIYSVFGKDFSNALLETSYELNGVSVEGFVSKPTASRPNRSMQFFFLNGRLVKSATASAALDRAYKDSIMVGKFPACVLNITLPFEMVDVNVHPAKTEVRFSNERPVFDAVYYAAKNAITVKDTPNRLTLAQQEVRRQGNFKPETGEQLKLDKKKLGRTELPEKIEGFWSKELPKEWERKGSGSSKKKTVAKQPEEPVAPTPTPLTASDKGGSEGSGSAESCGNAKGRRSRALCPQGRPPGGGTETGTRQKGRPAGGTSGGRRPAGRALLRRDRTAGFPHHRRSVQNVHPRRARRQDADGRQTRGPRADPLRPAHRQQGTGPVPDAADARDRLPVQGRVFRDPRAHRPHEGSGL